MQEDIRDATLLSLLRASRRRPKKLLEFAVDPHRGIRRTNLNYAVTQQKQLPRLGSSSLSCCADAQSCCKTHLRPFRTISTTVQHVADASTTSHTNLPGFW